MDGVSSSTASPTEGLRERRKRRTRERIVAEGLRLFTQQGYSATTCEQIAAAAEVSPATFYRYFPSKEDVVLRDEYDPLLVAALEQRPADEHPVDSMIRAIGDVLAGGDQTDAEVIRARTRLILDTPALRARLYEQNRETRAVLTEPLARRLGQAPDAVGVQVLGAAIVAALEVGVERWAQQGGDLADRLTQALQALRDAGASS